MSELVFSRLVSVSHRIINAAKATGTNLDGGLVYCSIPDQHLREMADLIESAEVRAPLKWRDWPPTEDGYYWFHSGKDRGHLQQKSIIVYVVDSEIIWPLSLSGEAGRWYGPLIRAPQDLYEHDEERPTSEVEQDIKDRRMDTKVSRPLGEQHGRDYW